MRNKTQRSMTPNSRRTFLQSTGVLAAGLYLWTAIGFAMRGQMWFAGMWAFYAVANVCFAIGSR